MPARSSASGAPRHIVPGPAYRENRSEKNPAGPELAGRDAARGFDACWEGDWVRNPGNPFD
jgi:hypothetical protein